MVHLCDISFSSRQYDREKDTIPCAGDRYLREAEMSLNRIYQGRVNKVELLTPKNKKGVDPVIRVLDQDEGDRLLWDYSYLFQDAVNYYLVCLMAMAKMPDNPLAGIKAGIDGGGPEYDVWSKFRRRGQTRQGMREVAKYFGLDPTTATFAECCEKALEGNGAPDELIDCALREVLSECQGGAVRNSAREMLPRICSPASKANTASDKHTKLWNQKKAYESIQAQNESHTAIIKQLRFDYYANLTQKEPSTGEKAKGIVYQALGYLKTQGIVDAEQQEKLLQIIKGKDLCIPAYSGGSINKPRLKIQFYLFLLLKYVAQDEWLFSAFREHVLEPKGISKDNPYLYNGKDALKQARGSRGYVFKAFTALSEFAPLDHNPVWKEFDIIAFEEALKALHQVEQKGEERKKKQAEIQQLLAFMDGDKKARERLLRDSETDLPPVLKGDPRIKRLEAVVKELRRSYELAEEEESDYTLSWRTIRGFSELAEKWNRIKLDGLSEEDSRARLKEKLTDLQETKSTTIGSVELFEKLMEPENRVIWQHSGEHMPDEYVREGYAANPLEAYVQRREWAEEVERLGKPVHLTPADPRYSCRQVELGDKNTFKGGSGSYFHEKDRLAVVAPVAIREGGIWKPQRVRIHYSAPRFLRDGLRGTEEPLTEAPWQQPMMEALGQDLSFPQDIHNHAVFLMPRMGRDGKIRTLLNFPVTLDPSKIVNLVGREQRWTGQFAGLKDKPIYLRWPEDNWGKFDGPRWYQNRKPFRVLSIDLGYRDAAGFSVIECGAGEKPAGVTREIGRAEGRAWHARVEHMGMLHLPGEDAKVWHNGEFKQEPYGQRGRLARSDETMEVVTWVEELGYGFQFAEAITRQKGLPEQNDLLLVVLRRAIGRLKGWQGLSWKLGSKKEQDKARAALQKDDQLPDDLKELIRQGKWPLVSERLEQEIEKLKERLSVHLERIANRVLPLKGRRWEWVPRTVEAGYVLRPTERGSAPKPTLIAGQRGLSMKRIEQIEELRRRCQALNRALQHTPGTRPILGYPTRGEEVADPCPEVLEKLEHLKEQRVDQTAHLILAEALGVRLKPHAKSRQERIQKDVHGEYEKCREPVDFIVLEDLNRYRTSQERSRQENSTLMKWSHRAVLIKIKQLAETYGFPVLEVAAAYSSRFSSRDGCAGFRAREIHAGARNQYPWEKYLDEQDADIVKLFDMLDVASAGQDELKPRKLLVPSEGGPIFVPMAGTEIQADINASINLGLRAVAAPDTWDIHHRIRTEMDEAGGIKPLRKNNREKLRWPEGVGCFEFKKSVRLTRQSNCFPVIGFRVEYENCTLDGRNYATGKGLWGTVKEKKWETIREINESRIQRWREKGLIPPADDIKMS